MYLKIGSQPHYYYTFKTIFFCDENYRNGDWMIVTIWMMDGDDEDVAAHKTLLCDENHDY